MTTVICDSIPQALKDLPQWVAWQREERNGKLTKVPYNAVTKKRASITNPADWATFDQAIAVFNEGGLDGVGLVLTADDPFAGIDLDHCLDPSTGVIEPWALSIIDQLHSYTERSPSGTGIRIFVFGKLPPGRRRKGPIEFYDAERYLTVTGNHLSGTPTTIEDRHATLQLVHAAHFPKPNANGNGNRPPQPITADDETQLARAIGSKNGTKIEKLWKGDTSDYSSHSEADSAFCCFLAYWLGRDPERMDRVFRQSGLMREKWDSRRGDSTYGAQCIANACETVTEVYQEPLTVAERLAKIRALSADDLKATWMDCVTGLNTEDRHTVLTEIARLSGLGINTLKARLREEQEQRRRQAAEKHIGDRTLIEYRPEDVCLIAREVETEMMKRLTDGECARFSDNVVRVAIQSFPHTHRVDSDLPAVPTAQFDLMTRTKLLPLIERSVVLYVYTRSGLTPISVPQSVLDQLLINPHCMPVVTGLSAHPLVTRYGQIIVAPGIDPSTRLLLYGPQLEGLRPYSKREALAGIKDISRLLFNEFEFASGLDRVAALALLFTAIERKLMDMSPGFLITAAQQSLGKTTLARLIHLILTGTDAPIFTWPDDDDVEVQKLLLSTLLRSPEIVTFDNCGDGMTFRSPALSSAMTSATKQGRLLGHNRDAVVSTSVVFIITGNNVSLANDESSRIIPVRLTTKAASPHKRKFTHPDVIRRALEIREPVLRHVIGVIAGFHASRVNVTVAPSRFPQWDVLVRYPLIWVGLKDVGTVFDQNIENSPELGAHLALMRHLYALYGENKFSASDLVRLANPGRAPESEQIAGQPEKWYGPDPIVRETLLALRVKDLKSERSVGHALSRVLGRNAVITEGFVYYLDRTTKNGLSRYSVKTRGDKGVLDDKKPQ